jgi:alpha-beta hydrolase superfamily lysophospholipase
MNSPTWGKSTWLCDDDTHFCLHMLSLEYDQADVQNNILLIHGTGHHAGVYDTFAPLLMKKAKSNVFAIDLKGKTL